MLQQYRACEYVIIKQCVMIQRKEKIMKEFKYVITDKGGIHARPAGALVKEAAAFPCSITIAKDGKAADAKRIFGVMDLV